MQDKNVDSLLLAKEQVVKEQQQKALTDTTAPIFSDIDLYKSTGLKRDGIMNAMFGDYVNRYDTYLPGADNERLNYENQNWAEAIGNGIGGMVFNAATSATGYYDAYRKKINAINQGDYSKLWDDEFSEQDYKGRNAMMDYFAVYDSGEKADGILGGLTKLATKDGVGNFLQSLGFTVGTAAGMITETLAVDAMIEAGTGGLGTPVAAGYTGYKLGKLAKFVGGSLYNTVKGLRNADKTFDALRTANAGVVGMQAAKALGKGAVYLNRLSNAVVSEGGMESKGASMEYIDEQIEEYKQKYGVEPPQEFIDEVKKRAVSVGNYTFAVNAPTLMLSDALMFGSLLKTGKFAALLGKTTTSSVGEVVIREGVAKTAKEAAKEAAKKGAKGLMGKALGTGKSILASGLPEMGEEMMQGIGSAAAKNHYDLFTSPSSKTFIGGLSTLVETGKDKLNLVDGELWQEGWSGFATGALMKGIGFGFGRGTRKKKEEQDSKLVSTLNYDNVQAGKMIDSLVSGSDFSTTLGSPTSRQRKNRPSESSLRTLRHIENGATQMNATTGMLAAEVQQDEKLYNDWKNESLKSQLRTNAQLDKVDAGIEIFAYKVDNFDNQDYAKQFMGVENASEADIKAHKAKVKSEFAQKQTQFKKDYESLKLKAKSYQKPYDNIKDPALRAIKEEQYDRMLTDIVFYKQDSDNAFERMSSVMDRFQNEIKSLNKQGVSYREADMKVIIDASERDKELARVNDAITQQEMILTAPDVTDREARIEELEALKEKQRILQGMQDVKGKNASARISTNAEKNDYNNLAKEWIKLTTGQDIVAETETNKLLTDIIDLEEEGRFFLTLYNSLLGDKKAFDIYSFGYLNEQEKNYRRAKQEVKEKEANENPEVPKAPISERARADERESNKREFDEKFTEQRNTDRFDRGGKTNKLPEDNRVASDIQDYYFKEQDTISVAEFIDKVIANPLVSKAVKDILVKMKSFIPATAQIKATDDVLSIGQVGRYIDGSNQIQVSPLAQSATNRSFEEIALNSITQLLTADYINRNPNSDIVKELLDIYGKISTSVASLQETYGVEDAKQMIAEAFTNPEFQEALSKIEGVEKKTLWDDVINVINKILKDIGVTTIPNSALSNVVGLTYDIIKKQEYAIQEQETNESVLRQEQSEMGLQEMERRDSEQEIATEQSEEQKEEVIITEQNLQEPNQIVEESKPIDLQEQEESKQIDVQNEGVNEGVNPLESVEVTNNVFNEIESINKLVELKNIIENEKNPITIIKKPYSTLEESNSNLLINGNVYTFNNDLYIYHNNKLVSLFDINFALKDYLRSGRTANVRFILGQKEFSNEPISPITRQNGEIEQQTPSVQENDIVNETVIPTSINQVSIGDEVVYDGSRYNVTAKNPDGTLNLQMIGGGASFAKGVELNEIDKWTKKETPSVAPKPLIEQETEGQVIEEPTPSEVAMVLNEMGVESLTQINKQQISSKYEEIFNKKNPNDLSLLEALEKTYYNLQEPNIQITQEEAKKELAKLEVISEAIEIADEKLNYRKAADIFKDILNSIKNISEYAGKIKDAYRELSRGSRGNFNEMTNYFNPTKNVVDTLLTNPSYDSSFFKGLKQAYDSNQLYNFLVENGFSGQDEIFKSLINNGSMNQIIKLKGLKGIKYSASSTPISGSLSESLIQYFNNIVGEGVISTDVEEMNRVAGLEGTKEMTTPNGQIYGMFVPNYNGEPKIFINPEIANNATLLEELGHMQYYMLDIASKKGDNEAQRILSKGEELFGKIADKWMEVSGEGGNADNRFQIIGEKGAEALDKAEEATIRLDNLKVAREMETAGKDAKTIRLATGWEKGADGKWRYEIEKTAINYNILPILKASSDGFYYVSASNDYVLDNQSGSKGVKVSESFVTYPLEQVIGVNSKLMKLYPQLSNIKVVYTNKLFNNNARGEWDLNTNTIRINTDYIVSKEEVESVLVHEIQHAIQDIEGFARGGNLDISKAKERADKRWIENNAQKLEKYKQVGYDNLNGKERLEYVRLENEWEKIKDRIDSDPLYEKDYKNSAGEVEARNVESRMQMSPEERRNTLLSETEDVAREDQIILFNALNTPENISESLQKLKEETGVDLTADVYRQGTNESNESYRKRLIDEIRNKLVAEYGAKSLEEQKGMLQSIKDFFKELYDWFATKAGLKGQDIEKMTMEEFVEASYNSLMKGEYLYFDDVYKKANQFNNFEDFVDSMSDFRDSHSAPSKDSTPTNEKLDTGGDFSLEEVSKGFHNQPDDYFDPKLGARYYGYNDKEGMQSFTAINNIIRGTKAGKENQKITAYRAIPKDIDVDTLKDYDWITFSKDYAIGHGESRFGEDEYKIIEQEVPIEDVWWDGNDINEWGYDTGNTKTYSRRELKSIWDYVNSNKIKFSNKNNLGADPTKNNLIQIAIQRNNGNPLNLAPNGKPSILYQSYKDLGYSDSEAERLVAQVYSDEFGNWFGKWWEINNNNNINKYETTERLSKEQEIGRKISGQINIDATIITGRVHRILQEEQGISNPNAYSKIKQLEENELLKYAEENNLFVNPPTTEILDSGNESQVYRGENGNTFLKVNNSNNNNSWLEFFDSIAIHNTENKDTQYKILGFTKDTDGNFSVLLEQNIILGTPADFETIHKYLINNGYDIYGEYGDGAYIKGDVILEDVKEDNVLIDINGNLQFIDTDYYINTNQKGGNIELKYLTKQNAENVSKVVDENGQPLVVYHSTWTWNLTEFNHDDIEVMKFDESLRGYHFFTENIKQSKMFGNWTLPLFLNIKNPTFTKGSFSEFNKNEGKFEKKWISEYGSDGFIANENQSALLIRDEIANEYVVWNPNQIKSATENIGTFSRESNYIRYSKEEMSDEEFLKTLKDNGLLEIDEKCK